MQKFEKIHPSSIADFLACSSIIVDPPGFQVKQHIEVSCDPKLLEVPRPNCPSLQRIGHFPKF